MAVNRFHVGLIQDLTGGQASGIPRIEQELAILRTKANRLKSELQQHSDASNVTRADTILTLLTAADDAVTALKDEVADFQADKVAGSV